jgi:hypothetical protein
LACPGSNEHLRTIRAPGRYERPDDTSARTSCTVMGLMKVSGCFIFVLFSCYVLLLAERGRRYLVGERNADGEGHLPNNHTLSNTLSSPNEDSESAWVNVGVNFFLLIATFLCYDLLVTNILLFFLATDTFFLRAPLRVLLCGMVGVLAAAAWFELPALREQLQQGWTHS